MNIEYEATFTNVEKNTIREQLRAAGAKFIRPEFMQKRAVFHLPEGHGIQGGWARVRDEGDKITMSVKVVDGEQITDQKESMLIVDNFKEAVQLLVLLGCRQKAFQESKRELWTLDGVEVTIDEWPFLEPFVEIEGDSEDNVRRVAEQIGFDWTEALFCAVGTLYANKYHIKEETFNNRTPRLVFDMSNPFIQQA